MGHSLTDRRAGAPFIDAGRATAPSPVRAGTPVPGGPSSWRADRPVQRVRPVRRGAGARRRSPGHLLVATPAVEDPNFWRRVILLLDHGVHGALGVVIDRPGGVDVDQLLPQWHDLATRPAELFTGGPVARNSLIGLVRLASRTDAVEERHRAARSGGACWSTTTGRSGTVDLGADPARLRRLARGGPAVLGATPGGSRASSRTRSTRVRGTWCGPRPGTRSRPIPRACGVGCCAARAVRWPWCRAIPADPTTN